MCPFASALHILEQNKTKKLLKHLSAWTQALAAALLMIHSMREINVSLSHCVSRANRKHVVHGGERGHAGADGSDGHV